MNIFLLLWVQTCLLLFTIVLTQPWKQTVSLRLPGSAHLTCSVWTSSKQMFFYIALFCLKKEAEPDLKVTTCWHLSSMWHYSFKPDWRLDNTRLRGRESMSRGRDFLQVIQFIQLHMSGAWILSVWLAVVLNVWLALFFGIFKHQDGVVDFEGRAKFDWHDLDDVLLCE